MCLCIAVDSPLERSAVALFKSALGLKLNLDLHLLSLCPKEINMAMTYLYDLALLLKKEPLSGLGEFVLDLKLL